MNSLEKIALSKIATIIAKQSFLKVSSNSVWDRILSNAGYEELYEKYLKYLTPYDYNGTYQNDNPFFKDYYYGVKSILKQLYSDKKNMSGLFTLLKSIVEEIDIEFIVEDSITNLDNCYNWDIEYSSIQEYCDSLPEKNFYDFFQEHQSQDFQEFINSLKILNLDLEIARDKNKIKILLKRFSGTAELEEEKSKLSEWLNGLDRRYKDGYEEALDNYVSGNAVATITCCRSLITGVFTLAKDDSSKWVMGLKKVSTDKNIEEITDPKEIINQSPTNSNGFKYTRFKTIYSLYSMASDLGDHSLEGPKIGGELYLEDVKLYDAHLVLRMTEDILIWVMESGRIKNINSQSDKSE